MFYVSSITGAVVPFDPYSNLVVKAFPVQQIQETTSQVLSAPRTPESTPTAPTASVDNLRDAELAQLGTQNIVDTEAAIYAGPVVSTPQSNPEVSQALNIARASATIIYQANEAEHEDKIPVPESVRQIGTVQVVDPEISEDQAILIKDQGYKEPALPKDRRRAVTAADIMSSPVFTLSEEAPLEEAFKVFRERGFRHIPIVSKEGTLIGLLSDRDFIGRSLNLGASDLIKNQMRTNVVNARPEVEIAAAVEVMMRHHLGALPIVDEENNLVGIVTRSDILRAVVNRAPIELWT